MAADQRAQGPAIDAGVAALVNAPRATDTGATTGGAGAGAGVGAGAGAGGAGAGASDAKDGGGDDDGDGNGDDSGSDSGGDPEKVSTGGRRKDNLSGTAVGQDDAEAGAMRCDAHRVRAQPTASDAQRCVCRAEEETLAVTQVYGEDAAPTTPKPAAGDAGGAALTPLHIGNTPGTPRGSITPMSPSMMLSARTGRSRATVITSHTPWLEIECVCCYTRGLFATTSPSLLPVCDCVCVCVCVDQVR